jgi:hypothetical protein
MFFSMKALNFFQQNALLDIARATFASNSTERYQNLSIMPHFRHHSGVNRAKVAQAVMYAMDSFGAEIEYSG